MNKELLKKAEELLLKEENVCACGHSKFNHNWHLELGDKNPTYDNCFHCVCNTYKENYEHLSLSLKSLPAIIELVSKEILDLVWHEMILHTPLKIEETSGTDFDRGYIFYQNMVIAGFKSVEDKLLDK